MAEHGHVEYATASGNDLPAHEATYGNFVQLAYVATLNLACILIALAMVGTTAHWGIAVAIILAACAMAAHGLASGAKAPSAVLVLISLLALGFAATA